MSTKRVWFQPCQLFFSFSVKFAPSVVAEVVAEVIAISQNSEIVCAWVNVVHNGDLSWKQLFLLLLPRLSFLTSSSSFLFFRLLFRFLLVLLSFFLSEEMLVLMLFRSMKSLLLLVATAITMVSTSLRVRVKFDLLICFPNC